MKSEDEQLSKLRALLRRSTISGHSQELVIQTKDRDELFYLLMDIVG